MLVSYTHYDQVTMTLGGYAQSIGGQGVVLAPKVLAADIQALLKQTRLRVLCFFGHGSHAPPRLLDQANQDLLPNPALLTGWVLYGACCLTLGPVANGLVRAGATVIGFTDTLFVPDQHLTAHHAGFHECLTTIGRRLLAGDSP